MSVAMGPVAQAQRVEGEKEGDIDGIEKGDVEGKSVERDVEGIVPNNTIPYTSPIPPIPHIRAIPPIRAIPHTRMLQGDGVPTILCNYTIFYDYEKMGYNSRDDCYDSLTSTLSDAVTIGILTDNLQFYGSALGTV